MPVALILGAAVWADGPSPTLVRRTRKGADLFLSGQVDQIVVSGGLGKHPPSEAEAMAALLLAWGIPELAIVLEDRSANTGENIRFAKTLIPGRNVIIVTDWYHGPRARLIARREGLKAQVAMVSFKGAKVWPQIKGALREGPAYLAYLTGLRR